MAISDWESDSDNDSDSESAENRQQLGKGLGKRLGQGFCTSSGPRLLHLTPSRDQWGATAYWRGEGRLPLQ